MTVENMSAYYGKYLALKDISFDVRKGDYIGVVGPNGSGKTTLIKCLLGLMAPTTGKVRFFKFLRS